MSHFMATPPFFTSLRGIKDGKFQVDIDSLTNKAVMQLANSKTVVRMARLKLQQ